MSEPTEPQATLFQLQETFQQTRCALMASYRVVDDIIFDVVCDEVYPNLFVGDSSAAKNKHFLKRAGITRVVNMAEGDVDTNASFYEEHNIKYFGVSITDTPSTKIDTHFQVIAKFISDDISEGGKVLVHCLMGYSRSAACAIAYLMICEGMSAVKACETIKSKHICRPNDGFLQQLVDLDNQLKGTNSQL